MLFHVSLEAAEDGWIVAECPALPGCVSQGQDENEALENIKEAVLPKLRVTIPRWPTRSISASGSRPSAKAR